MFDISAKNIEISYGDFVLMRHLNFNVSKGEVFIIMGGSGCGKSSLLKILTGLKKPAVGDVLVKGQSFWKTSREEQKQIMQKNGILYQSGALFSSMTLAENIALPLQQYSSYSKAEIADLVSLKLSLVGLAGFEEFYPSEISGGMAKRAGLARAMALDPDILFFDEPSAGLDPVSAKLLDDLILEIAQSLGTTIIVVTHDLASIFAIADQCIFLDSDAKTMTAYGSPQELLKNPPNENVLNFLTRGTKKK